MSHMNNWLVKSFLQMTKHALTTCKNPHRIEVTWHLCTFIWSGHFSTVLLRCPAFCYRICRSANREIRSAGRVVAFGTYDCSKIIEREMGCMFSRRWKANPASCWVVCVYFRNSFLFTLKVYKRCFCRTSDFE
jgi:hypothetical protein